MLLHRHLIATAILDPEFVVDERMVRDWLLELVDVAGMKVLNGPLTERCDDPGNAGITGIVLLTTSHASIHTWFRGGPDDRPYVQWDLYSCRDFNLHWILDFFYRVFSPLDLTYRLIDRDPSIGMMRFR